MNSSGLVHATDQLFWWSWLVMRTSCPLARGFFWHLPKSLSVNSSNGRGVGPRSKKLHPSLRLVSGRVNNFLQKHAKSYGAMVCAFL